MPEMSDTRIITIDGPAASGKGTLARRLAAHLGYFYFDTGAMYRLVGLRLINAAIEPETSLGETVKITTDIADGFKADQLANPDLKRDDVGQMASRAAVLPDVRAAVMNVQRSLASNPPSGEKGSVMDGRDCGTVICPAAAIKLFITADTAIRARRRFEELKERGIDTPYEEVLADMRLRDDRDTNRAVAPLKPAEDAVIIDTSAMNADEAYQAVLTAIGQ